MRAILSLAMGVVLMAGTAIAQERTRSLVKYDNVEIDLIAEGRGPLIVLLPSRGRDSEDYDEVAAGHVDHAIRFTVPNSQKGYIFPATHYASSSTDASLPPMGLRVRLKANFDLSRFHGESLVILKAMKAYGM